jgi:AraC-like DNA-binding protein
MNADIMSNCFVSPSSSSEQFIPDHTFTYLVKGTIVAYDGTKEYTLNAGEGAIGQRNRLAKYMKQPDITGFRKIYISFDQEFLKAFNELEQYQVIGKKPVNTFVRIEKNALIDSFIESLTPYFNESGVLESKFLGIKRHELLLILLKINPELANIFFDFGDPQKIDLEEFMNRNFKFNVTIDRFAYLTGRSLSGFKRDFESIFSATPSHWLVQKRLEEAHYLISKQGKRPSDIYLDLGFEDLSHFSFAFKKLFGISPSEIRKGAIEI